MSDAKVTVLIQNSKKNLGLGSVFLFRFHLRFQRPVCAVGVDAEGRHYPFFFKTFGLQDFVEYLARIQPGILFFDLDYEAEVEGFVILYELVEIAFSPLRCIAIARKNIIVQRATFAVNVGVAGFYFGDFFLQPVDFLHVFFGLVGGAKFVYFVLRFFEDLAVLALELFVLAFQV